MIGTTRAAACHLTATAAQVETIAGSWAAVAPAAGRPGSPDLCAIPGARGWEAPGGAPYLKLRSGGRFAYLRLYHAAASGTACLRVEYAYG